jgi:hypothetical protein
MYCDSRVAQQSKALHHSVAASLQNGVWSQAVSQLALTGSPIGWHTIVQIRRGFVSGGALLGSLHSSNSLWLARCLQAHFGCQLNSVSSDTLVQLASRLRSVVWRVIFWRTQESTLGSPEPIGERWYKNVIEKGGKLATVFLYIICLRNLALLDVNAKQILG